MTVLALQAIRRMRGTAQSHLMLGSDKRFWVVKFQNNPQHIRVLANEFIASRLAIALGLSVPRVEIIEVTSWLADNSPGLELDLKGGCKVRCQPGLHCGSEYVTSHAPGQVVDALPDWALPKLRNYEEFGGVLALDKWLGNADARQAVFHRPPNGGRYKAFFIDQGNCFNTGNWSFPDVPGWGLYRHDSVYREVSGWSDFEPWLSRIEGAPQELLWSIAQTVPSVWYGGQASEIERLTEELMRRRSCIRDLITRVRLSSREPFPKWH
jgi:hypothetical protein